MKLPIVALAAFFALGSTLAFAQGAGGGGAGGGGAGGAGAGGAGAGAGGAGAGGAGTTAPGVYGSNRMHNHHSARATKHHKKSGM